MPDTKSIVNNPEKLLATAGFTRNTTCEKIFFRSGRINHCHLALGRIKIWDHSLPGIAFLANFGFMNNAG